MSHVLEIILNDLKNSIKNKVINKYKLWIYQTKLYNTYFDLRVMDNLSNSS